MDGGGHNPIRMQQVYGKAHTGHVRHRVQRTHLMEMDLTDRHPVSLGLRLGNAVVDGLGSGFYFVGDLQRG